MSHFFPRAPRRRLGFMLIIALLMLACCQPRGYRLDSSHQARSQDDRITVLVLHYTDDDFDRSLTTLNQGPVSAHYLVPAPGIRGRVSGADSRTSMIRPSASKWRTTATGTVPTTLGTGRPGRHHR